MTKKYGLLVFIGRFQPFHLGHQEVVDKALTLANKVLILVGSANRSRSVRNPWNYEERKDMIDAVFENPDIIIHPLDDFTYNDAGWSKSVREKVNSVVKQTWMKDGWHGDGIADYKIGLIGCNKDHTSYYLKLFPEWESESVEFISPLNSTDVRKILFEKKAKAHEMTSVLPKSSLDIMFNTTGQGFESAEIKDKMIREYHFNANHKAMWDGTPYPVTFQTVDSLVEQSGHILLVKRKAEPGKGLWALPGGYINVKETLLTSALRELKEETKLKVPRPVLKGSIVNEKTYDDPHRSDRGRIITHVFHFKLEDNTEFPK